MPIGVRGYLRATVPRYLDSWTSSSPAGDLILEILVNTQQGKSQLSYTITKPYSEFVLLEGVLGRNIPGQKRLISCDQKATCEQRRESANQFLTRAVGPTMNARFTMPREVTSFLEVREQIAAIDASTSWAPRLPALGGIESEGRAKPSTLSEASTAADGDMNPSLTSTHNAATASSQETEETHEFEATLQAAVSAGLTTSTLAGRMRQKVSQGLFSRSHYIKMWSARLEEAQRLQVCV